MKQELDYYEILGVSKNATVNEIKTKYRILATKFHPDKTKSSLAEEMMKKINEVYEILSDPQKRKLYDENHSTQTESKATNQDLGESKKTKLKKLLEIWKAQAKTIGMELGKSLSAMAQSAAQSQVYSRPKSHDKVRRRKQTYKPGYDYDDSTEYYDDDYEYSRPKKRYRKSKRRKRKQRDDSESYDYRNFFDPDDSDFGFNVDEVFRI